MAKLSQTYLADEDCYELVNNIRVLQPKYLKDKQKRTFERSLENYHKTRELKRINETLVHQRSILDFDKFQGAKGPKFTNVSSTQKSRNRLLEDTSNNFHNHTVDYHMVERPRTQHALTRKRRTIAAADQFSNFKTLSGLKNTLTSGFNDNQNLDEMNLNITLNADEVAHSTAMEV